MRDAEVEQLHAAGRRHHHVRRLQVAMHQTLAMRFRERAGNLLADVEHAIGTDRRAAGQSCQRRPVHVLHRDVRDAPSLELDFARFVDDRDVWMVQGRRGPCLSQQPASAVVAGGVAEHLQRHDPAQLQVLGPIHVAHAAGGDPIENAIVRQQLANHANDCANDIFPDGRNLPGPEHSRFRRRTT